MDEKRLNNIVASDADVRRPWKSLTHLVEDWTNAYTSAFLPLSVVFV